MKSVIKPLIGIYSLIAIITLVMEFYWRYPNCVGVMACGLTALATPIAAASAGVCATAGTAKTEAKMAVKPPRRIRPCETITAAPPRNGTAARTGP